MAYFLHIYEYLCFKITVVNYDSKMLIIKLINKNNNNFKL